jgi:hypothetical protein
MPQTRPVTGAGAEGGWFGFAYLESGADADADGDVDRGLIDGLFDD